MADRLAPITAMIQTHSSRLWQGGGRWDAVIRNPHPTSALPLPQLLTYGGGLYVLALTPKELEFLKIK